MTDSNLSSVAMRAIKKQFMTYRNGIISDTLRSAGMECYSVIYGLNLPQLAAIALEIGRNDSLADELWRDKKVRESRLLAPYVYNPDNLVYEQVMALVNEVQTREEVEILCFKLLRKLPYAKELLDDLRSIPHPEPLQEYAKKMLSRNLE